MVGYCARKVGNGFRYLGRLWRFALYYWNQRGRAFDIARQAYRGDPEARMRVKRGVRYLSKLIRGLSPV
jgi:hypothetical protein